MGINAIKSLCGVFVTVRMFCFFYLSSVKFKADLFSDRLVATYGETDRHVTTNVCIFTILFMNTAKR